MMRSVLVRLAALGVGVVVVASCDTATPTSASIGGISSTGTVGSTSLTATIDTPTAGSLVNVGDSILVVAALQAVHGVRSVTMQGLSVSGSANLGTLTLTPRYGPITAPVSGSFRSGLRDTTIRRYLQPISTSDTTIDSLIVQVVVTDTLGAVDTTTRRVDVVAGPRVNIVTPASGDSTPAGIGLSVGVAAQDPNGIATLTIRVQGDATWPTKLDTSIVQTASGAPRTISFPAVTALVPANAPVRGHVTVTATAVNINGESGTSPTVTVIVRNSGSAQPVVNQVVGQRSEIGDSIGVTAHGDGIIALGYVARNATTGVVAMRDSVLLPQPYAGNAAGQVSLKSLPVTLQGQKITITSFAVDKDGHTGYAVRSTQTNPEGNLANALVDSTLVVYGHTYALPSARNGGLVGDLVWDAPRSQVILSNQVYNRLEVFHTSTKSFDPNGVAVGSFPWGLFISNDPNVLWVANSGGTNLSRVDLSALQELTAQRIRTRLTPLYTLTENVSLPDSNAAPLYTESLSPPVLYSDRPQYIGQLKDGTVYYSTRPTTDAPQGTLRYLDPTQAYPDAKAILIYSKASASITSHVVMNADSVFVETGAPGSDFVTMCDHEPGTNQLGACRTSNHGYAAAIALLKTVVNTDITIADGVDISSAGLTDTTYVAVSGDRNWIAFGAGHTAGSGNIFMSSAEGYHSPPISQVDLTNNAAEHVNGLALDTLGMTVAAHGDQSFFASVDDPFHLRLQGMYQNAAAGQGIVMHPSANAGTGDVQRTAYLASGNQTIEIADLYHYLNRGTLPIKANLYGPLRAALPGPTDAAAGIVLKLFGVSANGLVIIDLRSGDIQPSP